ncbi:MAG: flagellar basal body P-ring formation chaperone FlgA [Gammaproteobacteria bacterium]|nr:flagellar basal body P-ring formation chaperone FlgA [Gammaproteobacteria bacterium]
MKTKIRRLVMKCVNLSAPLLLLATSCLAMAQADGKTYQSHAGILAAAKQHLLDQVGEVAGKLNISLTPLDHRIKLTRCESPMETFSPTNRGYQGKTTVGIRCNSSKPWKLYVTAHIGIEGPVVVARRDLSRGSVIGANDVRLVTRDTNHLLRGHFDSIAEVTGRTLKRNLRREQVLTPSQLVTRKTIKRGQMVTILAGHSGIQVRMKGKALRNGNPGELIPVQNLSSKKQLEARVVAAGQVRIE